MTTDELGIYSEVPLLDRLQRGLAITLATLFAKPWAVQIGDLLWMVITAGIVSHELLTVAPRTGTRIFIVLSLFLFLPVWGILIAAGPLNWINRVAVGPPVFGKLGGLPRRTFFTACKCASLLKFKLTPADLEIATHLGKLDREVTEYTLQTSYRAYLRANQPAALADFDNEFAALWKDRVLDLKIVTGPNQSTTFGELLAEENMAVRIEPLRLIGVSQVVAPIMKMLQLAMAILLAFYLDGKVNLLTVIQAAVFLGLILCLVLFNYHAHQASEIPLTNLQIPDLPDTLRQRLAEFVGKVLRPLRVTVGKQYLGLVQNYFSVILATCTFVNAVTWLILTAIALLWLWFLHPASSSAVLHWYRHFAVGVLLIPVLLITTFNLMFALLRSFRILLMAVIIVLLTALLPYGISYLAGAHVDPKEVHNTYLAIGTSLVTGITAAFTSRIKKIMAPGKDEDEDEEDDKKKAEAGKE